MCCRLSKEIMFSCSLLFSKDLWGHDAPLKCFPTDTSSYRQCGLRLLFYTENQNIAQSQVARSEAKKLPSTRWINSNKDYCYWRNLGKLCQNQQTALELSLPQSLVQVWLQCQYTQYFEYMVYNIDRKT